MNFVKRSVFGDVNVYAGYRLFIAYHQLKIDVEEKKTFHFNDMLLTLFPFVLLYFYLSHLGLFIYFVPEWRVSKSLNAISNVNLIKIYECIFLNMFILGFGFYSSYNFVF